MPISRLPRLEQSEPSSPAGPGAGSGTGPVRVLVVDDDEPQCELACAWLEAMGHATNQANSPAEALKLLSTASFDVLFSDVAMPGGMDGIALANRARAQFPGLRCVLASSFVAHLLVDADLPGAVLQKPYSKVDLAAAIAAATI